jgi:hypothetical protein
MVCRFDKKAYPLLENLVSNHGNKADKLAEAYLYQLARVMALPQIEIVKFLLGLVFGRAAECLAEISIEFDHRVNQGGPVAGVCWILSHFVAGFESRGIEIIPENGPLVVAANHPSSYDALVISACINRPDYKIIIGDIPPYHYLPHVCEHVIFSPPVKDTFGRMRVIREAIQHLKQGGALLIFPRGNVEPDPAFMPDPDLEFDQWSRSLEIFLRRVPQTRVLVTIVSGVIAQAAMQHPITWLRKSQKDRQRLAYIYQIIRQVLSGRELFGLRPQVTFGEIVSSANGQNVTADIKQAAWRTLHKHLSCLDHPSSPQNLNPHRKGLFT